MKTNKIAKLENEIEKLNQLVKDLQRQNEELLSGYYDWCDTYEIARMLGISRRTIDDHRKSGLIPCSKLGGRVYFRKMDIHNILMKNLRFKNEGS